MIENNCGGSGDATSLLDLCSLKIAQKSTTQSIDLHVEVEMKART